MTDRIWRVDPEPMELTFEPSLDCGHKLLIQNEQRSQRSRDSLQNLVPMLLPKYEAIVFLNARWFLRYGMRHHRANHH